MAEYILRLFYELSEIALPLGITVGITLIAAFVLMFLSKELWVNQPKFKYISVFYDLSGFLVLRAGAVWLKFIIPIIYIAMYQSMSAMHFVLLALVMIIASLDFKRIGRTLVNFIGNAMLMAGVFFMSVLYTYMQTGYETGVFILVYIVAGIFIALYDFFLFITDLGAISEARTPEYDRDLKKLQRALKRQKKLEEDEELEKERNRRKRQSDEETEEIEDEPEDIFHGTKTEA